MKLHTLCRTDELPEGKMKAFAVGGTRSSSCITSTTATTPRRPTARTSSRRSPWARFSTAARCSARCTARDSTSRRGEVVDWANFPPGIQVLNVVRGEKALKTYKVSVKDGDVRVSLPA